MVNFMLPKNVDPANLLAALFYNLQLRSKCSLVKCITFSTKTARSLRSPLPREREKKDLHSTLL